MKRVSLSRSSCWVGPAFLMLISMVWGSEDPGHRVEHRWIRYGTHVSRIGTFDPHMASAASDRMIADMLFNGLLRYRPGAAPEIEPDLAAAMPDMQMVNGKQAWTFY